jgi:hypothetical protein
MKSRDLVTNSLNTPTDIRSDVEEEAGKTGPSPAEIRQRAFDIYIEHGGQGCDLDDYLDDWRQAERELREKYNRSNDESAKKK